MNRSKENSISVLFKWSVRDELKEYLENGLNKIDNLKLIFPKDCSDENIYKLANNANVIVGWRPTKDLLEHAPNLRLCINPGAGVQHLIPLFREITKKREIILVNGHGNSYFTAQHAVSLLLTLTNKICLHHEWLKAGKWRLGDKEAKSIPLRDRTIGLLGYGAVNQKVHKFLSGFDISFAILKRTWDSTTEKDQFPTKFQKFTPKQLHDFLKICNTVIIAVPQTSETTDLIKRTELKLLGENGLLINIARGPIVNEKDLYECLKEGIIKGAAIDVWYKYNPEPTDEGKKYPFNYPFYELTNIVLSPHRGASPFDDLRRWDEVIENISRVCANQTEFLNIVDINAEY